MPNRPVNHKDETHRARIARAVDATVAAVLAGDFPVDPILGREVSDLVSKAASLQKRHGHLLELGLVEALRASGRFEVLTTVSLPVTAAADSLVASTPPETLERIALRYDAPVVRTVNLDLVVIEPEVGWAGAYDCKRGNGALTQRLLRPLVRDLECAGILLRSFLRDRGHVTVDRVAVGLVDIYGSSGVPPHLVVNFADLDDHFGTPIIPILTDMNNRLAAAFQRAVPLLLGPLRAAVEVNAATASRPAPAWEATEPTGRTRTPTRLAGPLPRRDGVTGRFMRPSDTDAPTPRH